MKATESCSTTAFLHRGARGSLGFGSPSSAATRRRGKPTCNFPAARSRLISVPWARPPRTSNTAASSLNSLPIPRRAFAIIKTVGHMEISRTTNSRRPPGTLRDLLCRSRRQAVAEVVNIELTL